MSSVRLQLDQERRVFTCLDYVTGHVILHLNNQETISSITVKMEGIARSRLLIPRKENEFQERHSREGKAEVEVHKILYMFQKVFPAAEIREQSSGFTLQSGTYQYPFRFRIPINNHCRRVDSLLQKVSIEKGQLDIARDPNTHTRAILPPSLYGLPNDEASVKYFLKVTVNRPQFYKLNLRKDKAFVFLPIEPPRPIPSKSETYGRKQHVFTVLNLLQPPKKWGFLKKNSTVYPPVPAIPPRCSIEARLPAPAILTRCEPLGLRIILVKKDEFSQSVVLRQLQLRLFSTTDITAHDQSKRVVSVNPIFNTRTAFAFGKENAPAGIELEADPGIWEGAMIPESVPPSFRTCNITRSYHLEITCGLSYGMRNVIDQISIVLPIQVYSGIRPPEELLRNANVTSQPLVPVSPIQQPSINQPFKHPPPSQANKYPNRPNFLQIPSSPSFTGGSSISNSPVTPVSPVSPLPPVSPYARPSSEIETWNYNHPILDAPPTYEDAIIDNIAPVDGHDRRNRLYPLQEGYFSGISESDLTSPVAGPSRHARSASFTGF